MTEKVDYSIVHHELRYYESLGRLLVDNMGAKWRGEHVIQSSADEVEWSLL